MMMNKQARIDALTAQRDELDRQIEAIRNERELGLGLGLPSGVNPWSKLSTDLDGYKRVSICDLLFYNEEQAILFIEAIFIIMKLRKQPGVVDPSDSEHFMTSITSDNEGISYKPIKPKCRAIGVCAFIPAFATEALARAAIAAVGGEEAVIRAAKTLAFVGEE